MFITGIIITNIITKTALSNFMFSEASKYLAKRRTLAVYCFTGHPMGTFFFQYRLKGHEVEILVYVTLRRPCFVQSVRVNGKLISLAWHI
jgi:hypothetical protein